MYNIGYNFIIGDTVWVAETSGGVGAIKRTYTVSIEWSSL